MDTINIRFTFTRDLTPNELYDLKFNYKYIENISVSHRYPCTYNIGFSVPKFFSDTNVYLVYSNDFEVFKEAVIYLFKPLLVSAIVTRVDTPFTYLMKPTESFNDYAHIFQLFSHIYYASNSKGSFKNFENTIDQTKECYRIGDSSNINKANMKINIYDQYKKLLDCYGYNNNRIKNISEEFPDLPRRIRVEISRKLNRPLENFFYKDEYKKSYDILEKTIFEKEATDVTKEELSKSYLDFFKEYGIDPTNIIYRGSLFEYNIYREVLSEVTPNRKTLETRITKARKRLDDIDKSSLYKITLKKVLPDMRKEFQKQINL